MKFFCKQLVLYSYVFLYLAPLYSCDLSIINFKSKFDERNGSYIPSYPISSHYPDMFPTLVSPEVSLPPHPMYIATEFACLIPSCFITGWPSIPYFGPFFLARNNASICWPIYYACRDSNISYESFINYAQGHAPSTLSSTRVSDWLVITQCGISGALSLCSSFIYRYVLNCTSGTFSEISGIFLPIVRGYNQIETLLKAVLALDFFYESSFLVRTERGSRFSQRLFESLGFVQKKLVDDSSSDFSSDENFPSPSCLLRRSGYAIRMSQKKRDEKERVRFGYSGRTVLLCELLREAG